MMTLVTFIWQDEYLAEYCMVENIGSLCDGDWAILTHSS